MTNETTAPRTGLHLELNTSRSMMLELQRSVAALDLADATLDEDPAPLDALAATAATLSRLATAYAAPLHEKVAYRAWPQSVEALRARALTVLHRRTVPDAEVLLSGQQLEDIADALWSSLVGLRPLFNELDAPETAADLYRLEAIAEALALTTHLLGDYAVRRQRDAATVRGWAPLPPTATQTADTPA